MMTQKRGKDRGEWIKIRKQTRPRTTADHEGTHRETDPSQGFRNGVGRIDHLETAELGQSSPLLSNSGRRRQNTHTAREVETQRDGEEGTKSGERRVQRKPQEQSRAWSIVPAIRHR